VIVAVRELLAQRGAAAWPDSPAARVWESGRWDYSGLEQFAYGEDTTYKKGIAFLDGHGTIEDWGCGTAYARRFVRKSAYVGIDGSPSTFADQVADLHQYRSNTECIFMRHVLEHNHEWQQILSNALESFTKRLALVIFTPFVETTHVVTSWHGIPDIAFNKDELTRLLRPFPYREESLVTRTTYGFEHIFYVRRGRRSAPQAQGRAARPASCS
jgi:hypothetical protein